MPLAEEPGVERLKLGMVFQSDYRIPPFQREYTWTRENVETLIDDLSELVSSEKFYYLGQIVVTKPDPTDANRAKVVDGQQRLLTLQLVFNYLLKRMESSGIAQTNIVNITEGLRIAVRKPLDNGDFELRIRMSSEGEAFFRRLIESQELPSAASAETVTQKNLINAYEQIKKSLDDEDNDFIHKLQMGLRERALLTRLTIGSLGEALEVFEKINHRGVKLADADLLKNYLFRSLNDSEFDDVSRVWASVSKKVFKLKPKRVASINLFFRAELTARTGVKVPTDGLLNGWDRYLQSNRTSTNVVEFVRELEGISDSYCNFAKLKISDTEGFDSGGGLREFKSVQHLPVLLAGRRFVRDIREILVEIVEQRVLLSIYSGEGPQNFEKIVPEWAKAIRELAEHNQNPTVEEVLVASAKARENLPLLWGNFRTRFSQLHYEKDKRKIKFALACITGQLESIRNSRVEYEDFLRREFTLDHIEPRRSHRFVDDAFIAKEFKIDQHHTNSVEILNNYKAKAGLWTHSIGNLALIRASENSSMLDCEPSEKIPYYKVDTVVNMILCPNEVLALPVESHRRAVCQIQDTAGLSLSKWGPKMIDKRTAFLAAEFGKTFTRMEPEILTQSQG